ncbi:DUF2786 domain-containing protein [Blastopirellula marina]|uniref:Uncharacterized protein n=1 Tax=Blastopirellula marina TaxID=124 RepID=A0A2S8F7I6_9BACT|nr:DUF2786 domain-containing protein [Blastopirellula marina]PQO28116.1 hypothetical protein C5Y98_24730 [Blastopirellula marina]PTL41656.1 DUF2786 domain-containing protein [Blastopirellula marina]
MDKDKAIDLIQKLLRRTEENGATKGEAETAAAEAQRLMTKFNLSMAEAKCMPGDFQEQTTAFTNTDRVAVHVSAVIQEFYFVRIIHRGPLIVLFGESHNVDVAGYVFQFLHREFSRLCSEETGRLFDTLLNFLLMGPDQVSTEIDQKLEPYCQGLAMGLASRLYKEQGTFTHRERTALVVVAQDLDKALRDKYPHTKEVYTIGKVNPTDPALKRGIRRGREIQIREGIAGRTDRPERLAIGEGDQGPTSAAG